MAAPQPTISDLAASIAKDTETVAALLKTQGMPAPSFQDGAPSLGISPAQHPDAAAALDRALAATRDLHLLLLGPLAALRSLSNANDAFAIQAIGAFHVPEAVPLEGAVSYADIAARCGLPLAETKRILRYAMTSHIFYEPRSDMVAHTAASRLMRENAVMRAALSMTINETVAASVKGGSGFSLSQTVEALSTPSNAEDPLLSGWGLINNAKSYMFEELSAHHPERAEAMGLMMDFMSATIPTQPLQDNFGWAALGSATVVDVGGSHGPVSIALARAFPELRFVVQDLAEPVTKGRAALPSELADRIEFMEHDFFQPQPVHGADVYYFRAVMHNWPDKHCAAMLRALIPALKPGARVVINEPCVPEPGTVGTVLERDMRSMDLNMLHLFNAKDRESSEWEQLFAQADARFKFQGVKVPVINKTGMPTASLMCIIEAVWSG